MVSELTLSKGTYTATIYAIKVEDGYKNKLFIITPGKGKNTQSDGPATNLGVDLLRLTRSFRIDGYIKASETTDTFPAKLNGVAQDLTANQVKEYLIKIIEGGGIDGGTITFTFSEGGDATSFEVFIEDLVFRYESQDEPASPPADQAKHQVSMSLIKGTQVG